jgi:hypothetical protein
MHTALTPRQGPVDHSISDQILQTYYYATQVAAVSLANAAAIDLRGKRSVRVLVFESQAGSMSGKLGFYFSSLDTPGSDAGYESTPSQEHIVTATAATGNLIEYYHFDLRKEGCSFLRIPVTTAITNGTVSVTHEPGE